ncbi:MAG: polysaccharide deacetylase family protein [Candidatus Paceibacterota bacterium]
MRNTFKTALLIFSFLLSQTQKRKLHVSVLMYHGVEDSGWKYSVRADDFKKQLRYIVEHYEVVPLRDIVAYVREKKELPGNAVALTFDDGYEDFYTNVFPQLRIHNVPATVFLTTNLEKKTKLGNLPRLTWRECKEMYESGLVSFEVHGREHLNLKEISDDDEKIKSEILGCAKDIETNIGAKPRYIAYASGHKNQKVINFVRNNGFEAGFSINEGLIRKVDDSYIIRRTQVDGTMNFLLFKLRLTPAIEYNRRFVDSVRRFLRKY